MTSISHMNGPMRSRCSIAFEPCGFRSRAARRFRLPGKGPRLNLPASPQFDELMGVSYSDIEEHTYHAIEAMQSVAERRGETGVAAVRYLEGDDVYKISPQLLEAALATRVNPPPEDRGSEGRSLSNPLSRRIAASVLNLNSKTRDYLVRRPASRRSPSARYLLLHLSLRPLALGIHGADVRRSRTDEAAADAASSERFSRTASCSPDWNHAARRNMGRYARAGHPVRRSVTISSPTPVERMQRSCHRSVDRISPHRRR